MNKRKQHQVQNNIILEWSHLARSTNYWICSFENTRTNIEKATIKLIKDKKNKNIYKYKHKWKINTFRYKNKIIIVL